MKYSWLTLFTLAGCPIPTDTDVPVDSDSDVVDTEITVHSDTFTIDTSWVTGTDTDVDTDVDTDATDLVDGECRFGYAKDCNNRCFPEYMVGDGFCDDGSVYPADFACLDSNWDSRDCEPQVTDTDDTDVILDPGCKYIVEFTVVEYAEEIGWRIQTPGLNPVVYARVDFGDYTRPGVHITEVYLPDGDWSFIGVDDFGDGWNGGRFRIYEEESKRLVNAGGTLNDPASSRQFPFSTECTDGGCDMDVTYLPGSDAAKNGYDLYTSADFTVVSHPIASLPVNAPTTERVRVHNGNYILRTRDIDFDGWDGGLVEARYRSGFLGTSTGMFNGGTFNHNFRVTCPMQDDVPNDAAPAPIEVANCDNMRVELSPGTAAIDVGYYIYRVDDWSTVVAHNIGSFGGTGVNVKRVDLTSGTYYIDKRSRRGAGWTTGSLSLLAPVGPTSYLTTTFPTGYNGGKYFTVNCQPPVIDTDVDTDEPIDTDAPVDTDAQRTCLPGAIEDCNGICFPATLQSDGNCDDGVQSNVNFNCAEFSFDGGDCPAP